MAQNIFSNMHVLSVDQFDTAKLDKIFSLAESIEAQLNKPDSSLKLSQKHSGKQVCTLFYEPSTRTRLSFETAALKLGMGVVSTENAAGFSSAAKGETLEDTINVLNNYGLSAIIIRHNETGAAAKAAAVSKVPVLNAGDGVGDHPTQALLDAYTIKKQFGRLDNLKVVVGGDLKNGRTVRSLCKLLSLYPGNHVSFVSIPELQMEDDIKQLFNKSGTTFDETDSTDKVLPDTQVVYWTRLQKERMENASSLDISRFTITPKQMALLPKDAILMHPLPRVHEISTEVDNDPRAKYFQQAGNGLYIRMALLDQIADNN